MSELAFHPLADIFPLLSGNEFDALVADINTHGVIEPIWLYESQLIDGRNRYRACQQLSIECPTRIYDGDDPVGFRIAANAEKIKTMNKFQRACVVIEIGKIEKNNKKTLNENHRKWIKLARNAFSPGFREPCYVCLKYQEITHAHHVYPLLLQARKNIKIPIQNFYRIFTGFAQHITQLYIDISKHSYLNQ